jgi:hypothetical protein
MNGQNSRELDKPATPISLSLPLSLFVVVDAFVCCGEFGISSLGDGDKDVCVAARILVICDPWICFANYVKLAFNSQF